MPNLFARQTSLTDVKGRLDYIGNPLRQEHLLATYDTASHLLCGQYWDILATESQAAFEQFGIKTRTVKSKSGKLIEQTLHCCEAKEIFFLIANELLEQKSGAEILKIACNAVSQKINRPVTAALHINKSNSSLHIHIIYSERQLLPNQRKKVAERNLFFDSCGKRRYKKSEIMDENGQLLPGCRIVKKGELYDSHYFASVDKKMVDKKWLKDLKTNCILLLRNNELKGDIEITEYDPKTGMLPQQYIGNNVPAEIAAKLVQYNAMVREYNAYVKLGLLNLEEALFVQHEVNSSKNKNEVLTCYVLQIRKRKSHQSFTPIRKPNLSATIKSAEYRSSANSYWKQYRAIRDKTWTIFLEGQRNEINELQRAKDARKDLYTQNSRLVWNCKRNEYTRKMLKPQELEENHYFEQKEDVDKQIKQHKTNIEVMRKYQEVAKGRQKIIQAMLLAGAEQEKVEAAMRNYEEAMSLLQYYTCDPSQDYENRRLKAAQESLARAQVRADIYIKQLKHHQTAEDCVLEQQVYQEHEAYQTGKGVPLSPIPPSDENAKLSFKKQLDKTTQKTGVDIAR